MMSEQGRRSFASGLSGIEAAFTRALVQDLGGGRGKKKKTKKIVEEDKEEEEATSLDTCLFCGTSRAALPRCARCHRAMYCGKACQTAGWAVHKAACVATTTAK